MIPKILLQVSREPFLDEVNAGWAERNGCGWKIDWYDDERILEYFDENPLPEFPNIVDVFNSFTGAHKSDLFRYYYLYLNGGVFCDSDLMLTGDLSELDIDGHDHLFTVCDLDMNVNAGNAGGLVDAVDLVSDGNDEDCSPLADDVDYDEYDSDYEVNGDLGWSAKKKKTATKKGVFVWGWASGRECN